MKAVGFDSIKLELGAFSSKFEGLLGIAVTAEDETSFREKYTATLKTLFTSEGINCDRIVCKAVDIAKILPESERMVQFLGKFFENMSDEIERLDVYYTRYNSMKLPSITIYGEDRPERIKPVAFIRKIANGYPHICAWRYLSSLGTECTVYLDHFEADQTPAWRFLSNCTNFKVLFKGGNCNCLLSSADLFVRLTVLLIKRGNESFNRRGLENLYSPYSWANKVSINMLGGQTYFLKNMTPYSRTPIDPSPFLNHPIVFIPLETPGDIKAGDEHQLLENMPIYNRLLNFLFHIKGTFKYFTPQDDVKLVQKGDYLLVLGKKGEELFNYLTAGGVPLIKLTLDEINLQLQKMIH